MLYSLLLAGGKSSRMGQDKAGLKIGEHTLLQQSLNLLKDCGSQRVLISGSIDGYDSIPDLLPECGPLGGLYSSLAYIKQEYGLDDSPLLIIPVDMPLLRADVLEMVIAGIGSAQCCHFENEVFPCVMRASEALYRYMQEIFSEGTELGGKRSMKGLMKYLKASSVSANTLPGNVFFNINRPEDWVKYSESKMC